MNKEAAHEFWSKFLRLACHDHWSMPLENPAICFTRAAKRGDYDNTPDDEYYEMMHQCEQESLFWEQKRSQSAGKVFLNALAQTDVDPDAFEKITDILSECSVRSCYEKKAFKRVPLEQKAEGPETEGPEPEDRAQEWPDHLPQAIYERLNQRVMGQKEAKKAAALVVFNHLSGRRSNALFCGPSGCGKSEIWRCLARDYPGLVSIYDGSQLRAGGWKGNLHLRDLFSGWKDSAASPGRIIVLDEADKLCCEPCFGPNGTNFSTMIQNELLKMLDGDVLQFSGENLDSGFSVDCSKVSVVLLGAFESLMVNKGQASGGLGFGAAPRQTCDYGNTDISFDDLINAGMRREIASRINRIVSLRPLSVSDYRAILTGPVLDDLQCLGKLHVRLDADTEKRLPERAVSMGLGVRWMRSKILNAVDDMMFDTPNADEYFVSIPPEELAG